MLNPRGIHLKARMFVECFSDPPLSVLGNTCPSFHLTTKGPECWLVQNQSISFLLIESFYDAFKDHKFLLVLECLVHLLTFVVLTKIWNLKSKLTFFLKSVWEKSVIAKFQKLLRALYIHSQTTISSKNESNNFYSDFKDIFGS